MPNIGFTEIAVLLGVAVLLFGSKRLPEAARGLGRTFNAFKEGLKTVSDDKNT
ncbi:MAG: twin-arginine translocase TatA/TatE family subunit [Elusimicrobia bacterium CG11_big_fil_rev_8_21_14_0_20_64_6]|nr:MAG: twin-arginine translocase TatA/TatE family subunit [Elusimicrobia bacterium CG11_big_fil_rev_8_21_14_0_20_64_6]